jgi:hypothetical protein
MTTQQRLTTSRPVSTAGSGKATVIALSVVNAVLLLASGWIHFHLWHGPYRHLTIGHINVLFLLQWISCLVAAVAVLALRRVIIYLGAAALMAGTFIGFLISHYRTAGLFGWHDPSTTSYSTWALIVEIAGTVLLLATTWMIARDAKAGP